MKINSCQLKNVVDFWFILIYSSPITERERNLSCLSIILHHLTL
nr:MAG TPA: hypothetical protein [Caudoviricetes sp.]